MGVSEADRARDNSGVGRLKCYLAEFDFRYSHREALGHNDRDRMAKAIPGIVGKRLTYRGLIEKVLPSGRK